MPANPVFHTYADVAAFRDYLAGSNFAAGWTADAAAVRRILESASRAIDQYIGGRSFGQRSETRSYDLGRGALRSDALLTNEAGVGVPDYWPARLSGIGILPLDDWLLAASAVTAYADTARTSNVLLVEGIAGDYLLEPYNESPKRTLKLQENTVKTLNAGQQTLVIAGTWGWHNVSRAATTLSVAIADAVVTTFTAADAAQLAVGQTVRVESEQLYITSIAANIVTVVRGVNGTTAAAHSSGLAVAVIEYPADVVQTCLEIARNRWKERDAGTGQIIGSSGMDGQQITRPGAEERALLRRLNYYLGQRERGGLYF